MDDLSDDLSLTNTPRSAKMFRARPLTSSHKVGLAAAQFPSLRRGRTGGQTVMTAVLGGNSNNSETVHFERERGVTEVQVTRGVAHVTVSLSSTPLSLSRERLELLRALAEANIPVFMVKLVPEGLSFALRESVVEAGVALLAARDAKYSILRDLGQVAVVAGAMRDLSGVMALIYQALVGANVLVRQTGDAYNAVVCLVAGDEADRAAEALRDCFFQPRAATAEAKPSVPLARKGF